jgi:hypothetical protein
MVADLLQVFARTCGGRLPNKLVFYRDGVDEGQYQKVLDHEVTRIKAACRSKSFKCHYQKMIYRLFIRCLWEQATAEINIYCCKETS